MIMILKICSTIFSTLSKAVSVLTIIALLTPIAYFAWRVGQPMGMSEFHGLTYFQLITERQEAYSQLAHSYQVNHPDVEVKADMCFGVELGIEIMVSWPHSSFYTLAGLFPSLKRYVNPRDLRRGYVPENVTFANFLPTWWKTFELFIWSLIKHAPQGSVAYCRIAVP
jgi:hypothetical protein